MSDQPTFFRDEDFEEVQLSPQPVTCLGMTFESDEARREYFREELRKQLPELRKIEGFPIGEDDDIINLSDPPYYTACPNPWLNDFIAEWEKEKEQLKAEGKRSDDFEVKEPYASDVSEGKNHPIYNAHGYHTKVPHYAIMNYYLHYTQPGDVVVDNFGGTGMAGVAANYCGAPDAEAQVYFNKKWKEEYDKLPHWGYRNAIIGDLSPIGSFITYNYTNTIDAKRFKQAAEKIFAQLKQELGHLYKYKLNGKDVTVNYTIWSEIQVCPNCSSEFVLWDVAVDFHKNIQLDKYECPHCKALIEKRKSIKAFETVYDELLNETISKVKNVPVVINFTTDRTRSEYELNNIQRQEIINLIQSLNQTSMYDAILPDGGETQRNVKFGITHVHQFYTKRNLHILLRFRELIEEYPCDLRLKNYLRVWFTSCQSRLHLMNRYAVKHHRHVGPMANTLYISATPTEISPFYFISSKIKDNTLQILNQHNVINQVASATRCCLPDNTIDYIFTDPPFGANIMYSELNFLWESWLKVKTDNTKEAICNETQKKGLPEYQELMLQSFKEYYRILKPGKWITVEFSNTSSSVWNSIQNALKGAGFVIATVSDLNKGRGGLHGIVGVVAVNQDLAITCYKPTTALTNKFKDCSNTAGNIWDFISELLEHLPVHLTVKESTTAVVERSPKILYDRLIAYYVQHGYAVPIDAIEFQRGLKERFIERDGMYFTASQALEYEEKRAKSDGFVPMALFIGSEAEGIEWLKRKLETPKTYQELQPDWMKDMVAPKKGDVLPGLDVILEENFIKDEHGKWSKPDPENASHLEQLRGKRLMKEFNLYLEAAQKPKAKRMKDTRLEVLRYGFKECYKQKNYQDIVTVGDHIPESLLMEDEILLQYYDIAMSRV